ncbi:MAG: zinc-binding dehydrogenase [Saprospiraceae bacterium]|nr:zinc-binding dehydrogenase [Saprospiraceae bacterium]
MLYSGLNHRDVWMTKGLYPNLKGGVTLGSDGVGTWEAKRYLVNPNVNWGEDALLPGDQYRILGMPDNGTFAEKILIGSDRLVEMPGHLSLQEAGGLSLAGLTAYRALINRCQLEAHERLCISGIGGGVALFALQFALARGAEVWVTSSSQDKIEKAISLGASGGYLYTEDSWHKSLNKLSGGFDVIIDSAGGLGFSQLVSMAKKGARIGIYGGSKGLIQDLSPQTIFWKHLSILGSTMGSDKDFREMVDFVAEHKIHPIIGSVYKVSDFQQGFQRMDYGAQFGKIVFDHRK